MVMDQINKVIELKDKIFKKKLSKDETQFIRKVYFGVFGKRLSGTCGTCIIDAYFELKNLTKQKIESMKNRLFQIKDGEVLSMHGMAESYTNANLTNRAALTVLKLNRGCIKFFTKFPENWAQLAESFDLRMTEAQADALVVSGNGASGEFISNSFSANENPVLAQLDTMDFSLLKTKALDLGLTKKDLKGKGRKELVQFIYDKIKE